ncbi:MAG TPA: hypothetical protein VMW57_03370 [Methyloceanibacter sp.]|nr:hypothetical protein [Methyloceanibacter sp.]
MTEPTNTVRNSLAEKARTLTLGPDALHWSDASGGESHLAYKDVRDLRLIAFALPVGETFQCTLRGKKGDKVKLRSAHYQSLNNFEDRTATYAPFIRSLAPRIAAAAPDAKSIAGSTALWIVWLILGLLCLGVVLLLILSLFEGLPPVGAWVIAIGVCIASVPLAWRRIREGSAHSFDPAAPTPELIGRG